MTSQLFSVLQFLNFEFYFFVSHLSLSLPSGPWFQVLILVFDGRCAIYLADHNKMIVKGKFPPVTSNSVNGLVHFLAMKTLKSGTKM